VSVRDCLRPLEMYRHIWAPSKCARLTTSSDSEADLLNLIHYATGIVQWADPSDPDFSAKPDLRLESLVDELRRRLNALHLCPQPLARKRVALVRGRPNMTAGSPVYFAAQSLGVRLVIVDEAGHWLQANTDENMALREAFLVTDMAEDAGIVDRITETLRAYPLPIHGIFTLSDNFFVAVASVAAALGLPTCPVSAFETSVDKYLSRLLQASPSQTARVDSIEELQDLMSPPVDSSSSPHGVFTPSFPAVVKPTKGWSSECVSKVNNIQDLTIAVTKATGRHGGSAVIEPFFAGPEIDVNFVLLDGEILFCEISDEQPCAADADSATVDDNFSSAALTLPSALPTEEQEAARTTLHDILVNLGFRTGVFHVEARIVHSRYEYRRLGTGVLDLVAKSTAQAPTEEACCRLIEINARPPGYRVTLASKYTYGVDFFAAQILAAVGDDERLRLVAQPFSSRGPPESTGGSQCWTRLVFIPAPRAGIVKSDQPCEELKRRRPDLARHIVAAVDYYQLGDRVPLFTDGASTFVAHVLVSSRGSRLEAITVSEDVRQGFKMEIEGDDR